MVLEDLTAEDLDDLYARLRRGGVGVRTVNHAHSAARVALQRAVKKRLIPFNPARDADPPPYSTDGREYATLSEEDVPRFFEAPKSGKGRQVRLTRKALVALKDHRRRQLAERMQTAAFWRDHGLVFPSIVGTPLSGGNLTRAFKATLKRAGLPEGTRFHDLRHTCATLLLRQGVNPKYVQELLGHADISLTLNFHSHVLPDMGAAAGAMDAALEYA